MPIETLVNLLKSQKQLKTLHLQLFNSWYRLFVTDELANVDFQLETLSVEYRFYHKINFENFKKFLINQKSLRKFRVEKNDASTSFNYKYADVVRNFENRKELYIPGPCKDFQSMPNIEKLSMNLTCQVQVNHDFRELFPNLNDLSIYSRWRLKFVNKITESASKDCLEIKISENVKTLTLNDIKFENYVLFDDDVDINIENLTLFRCDNINWLIDRFKNNRIKLKSLTIDRTKMKKSQQEYLESLTRGENKKIEKLKIYNLMKLNENREYVCDYMKEDDNYAKRIKLE